MTRIIKAREIKEGMTIQLQVEVDSILEDMGRVAIFQWDGPGTNIPENLGVEVLSEPQPDEPAPGSVVRASGGDTFCRTENRNGCWQRVNGTGEGWTWNEILALADGDLEILFKSEGS